ncbi:MAG: hypothetical protein ACPGMR_03250 [Pontibacterium sp.]
MTMTTEEQLDQLNKNTDRLTDEVLTVKSVAKTSADQAKLDADRATAAQSQLSNELALCEAARDDAQAAAELAEAIKLGDEDYVAAAVSGLVGSYSNAVALKFSDEHWRANAHRFGWPTDVLAIATQRGVFLHDVTKTTTPLWYEKLPTTVVTAGAKAAWAMPSGVVCTSLAFAGSKLVIGLSNESQSMAGALIVDFAEKSQRRIARYSGAGGFVRSLGDDAELQFDGLVLPRDARVSSMLAFFEDVPPISALTKMPEPTIAIGHEGGVDVLLSSGELEPYYESTHSFNAAHSLSTDGVCLSWIQANAWSSETSGTGLPYASVVVPLNELGGGGTSSLKTTNWYFDTAYRVNSNGYALSGGQLSESHLMSLMSTRTTMMLARGAHLRNQKYVGAARLQQADHEIVSVLDQSFSTPFLFHDTRFAVMCDGVEGVLDGQACITNGKFEGVAGWTSVANGGQITFSEDGVRLEKTSSSTGNARHTQDITIPANQEWLIAFRVAATGGNGQLQLELDGDILYEFSAAVGYHSILLTGDGTSKTLSLVCGGSALDGTYVDVSWIADGRAVRDRSGYENHAFVVGALNRSKPAGSDLVAYSDFTPENRLLFSNDGFVQADRDWCISFCSNSKTDNLYIGQCGADQAYNVENRAGLLIGITGAVGARTISVRYFNGNVTGHSGRHVSASWPENSEFKAVSLVKRGDDMEIWIDGLLAGVGSGWSQAFEPAYDLLSISQSSGRAVVPFAAAQSAPLENQIRDAHLDMLAKLKKPSFLTAGVRATSYDKARDQAWIACAPDKLHRLVDNAAAFEETVVADSSIGAIADMAVSDGIVALAGASGVWISKPAKNLRETKVIKGKSIKPFDLGEGDSVEVDFYLPIGWKPVRVYVDGVRRKKGAQDDWLPMFDGYRWFIRFDVAPGAFDIECDAEEI